MQCKTGRPTNAIDGGTRHQGIRNRGSVHPSTAVLDGNSRQKYSRSVRPDGSGYPSSRPVEPSRRVQPYIRHGLGPTCTLEIVTSRLGGAPQTTASGRRCFPIGESGAFTVGYLQLPSLPRVHSLVCQSPFKVHSTVSACPERMPCAGDAHFVFGAVRDTQSSFGW